MSVTVAGPSPAAAKPAKTGETVTIACKLPNGLLAELLDLSEDHAMKLPNGQIVYRRIAYPDNEDGRLLIKGSAAQRRIETGDGKGIPLDVPQVDGVASGFGLTSGVDKDWAVAWFEQNRDYPAVKRGLIFMQGGTASAKDAAKDRAEIKSGLEPLNPRKPAPGVEPANEKIRAA